MTFQKLYLSIYKIVGFVFLFGMVVGILIYGFFLIFYSFSNSWAAPLVLSPSQERVLSFQPQITTLQTNLNKQKNELNTARKTVEVLSSQIEEVKILIGRMTIASDSESRQLEKTGKEIQSAVATKRRNIKATDQIIKDANALLKQVDDELAAKLITSDQAAQRKIALQAAINAATDSKAQAIQLEQQARQLEQGSSTLVGGASSLTAMTSVKQLLELKSLLSQLEIQLEAAKSNTTTLEISIKEGERVFEIAKTSPYHRALFETVTVAFVPYENLDSVSNNDPVYYCYLKVIICTKVGKIIQIYDAEEYARHPLFKTELRGKLIEINFKETENAKSEILFIGGKPLLF